METSRWCFARYGVPQPVIDARAWVHIELPPGVQVCQSDPQHCITVLQAIALSRVIDQDSAHCCGAYRKKCDLVSISLGAG
jgi:hypothetical protein